MKCSIASRNWWSNGSQQNNSDSQFRLFFYYPNSQLSQLCLRHRRGSLHHQIFCGSGFREGNYLAQTIRSRQNHHDAVEAERNTAMRRRAVFERIQEKAEARARLCFCHSERVKNSTLYILAMNTD